MFQSTHPRRVWLKSPSGDSSYITVSIHTPTQGVTLNTKLGGHLVCFNPHTHAGCDLRLSLRLMIHLRFQSTHPRRVWPCDSCVSRFVLSFNPHTHAGCDRYGYTTRVELTVSIHTPTQGVTAKCFSHWEWLKFQSTHPRRVWRNSLRRSVYSTKFQSTHPRRVWLSSKVQVLFLWRFQSTHPRRVWRSM